MELLINTSRKSFAVGRPFERKVDDNGYQRARQPPEQPSSRRDSRDWGPRTARDSHRPHELRNRT